MTVWENDQVITEHELLAIVNGYVLQYEQTRRFNIYRRFRLIVAVDILMVVYRWLKDGKPGGLK